MKKHLKKAASVLILFLLINLTGCWQDGAIFYEIRKDVKPEEPTVSGVIANITIYTADCV